MRKHSYIVKGTMMPEEYPIILENVSFYYKDSRKPALKNIDLKVRRGETVVLVGRTGAGKTTMIYSIGGIIPNYIKGRLKGDVIIDGMNTKEYSLYELAQHVGVVMEDPEAHIVAFTVEDDVAFGPCNLGLLREEIYKRIEFALEATRLTNLRKNNPYNLSGGEKQSLAIAGILAMRPDILALDEPTSMLDPLGRERIYNVLRSLKEKYGITMIFSSHDTERIVSLADRIIVLYKGEIILEGHPSKVFQEVDVLEKVGVPVPSATKLAYLLRKDGIWNNLLPLTLEEIYNFLMKYINMKRYFTKHLEKQVKPKSIKPIIKIRNLIHMYPNKIMALRGINLDIYEGEFVALVGQNGSGKTTLARHIAGLLKPSNKDAEIVVDGLNIIKARMRDIIKKVGYVFQIPEHQIFHSTTREELEFGLRNLGFPENEIKKRVDEVASLLGLKGYENEWPLSLDRGKRFRIVLGSILAIRPKIIIVDEPTTGQDWNDSKYICEILRKINAEGHTIIMITHEMDLVASYATRVIALYKGQVLLDGNPRNVFTKLDILRKTWIQPPQITRLGLRLKLPSCFLTIDEFYDYLRG